MKNLLISEDKLFQAHIESEKLSASRSLCLFGALLYIVFIIADLYSVSTTFAEVLLIRGAVVTVMLAIVAASFIKNFVKYYDVFLSFVYFVSAAGIEAMIYLALPEDHASNVYFAGLLLTIMTVFSWAYFKFITSMLIIGIIIGSYAYLGVVKEMTIPSLLVNILFLISAASIGFISQIIRDRHVRENFLLQRSLKEALDAKTEEAEGNAYLANHDPLTGLSNRRYVTHQLESLLQTAKQKTKILLILFIDLNGFKQINDIYGHKAGDEVLRIVARRLELAIRGGDCLSRLGGDEYLIGLLIEKENLPEVESLVDKYTAIISDSINVDGQILKVGASIGMSAYPMHGNTVNVLMDIADKKMYQVKHGNQEDNESVNTLDKKVEPVVIFPGNRKQN